MRDGQGRVLLTYRRDEKRHWREVSVRVEQDWNPDWARRDSLLEASVFKPHSTFLPIWGSIMILTIIYQALVVPYMLAFSLDDTLSLVTIDFICTVLYILDVLISCNTAFFSKGKLVTSRIRILCRYMRTWLLWDMLSTFPYDWVLQSPFETNSQSKSAPSLIRMTKIARLLRALRLVRLAKMRTHLSRVQQKLMDSKLAFLFTSVYLLIATTGLAHWVACGFYYVGTVEEGTRSWVFAKDMQDSSVPDLYVASLYWTITTLTTTGYGDIVPINPLEKLYGIFIMILSAATFSVVIGKIGASIKKVDADEQEHKEFMWNLTSYLINAAVPERVILKATRYMNYVWVQGR